MKKILLSVAIVFAFSTAQAQLNTGGLFNKAKDKAKQKAEDKANQEADKLFTKNNKKEEKNKETTNTSNNTVTTETKTTQPPVVTNTNVSGKDYIDVLDRMSILVRYVTTVQGSRMDDADAYYNRMEELNLANFYPVMQKKGKPSDYNGGLDYDEIMKVRNEFPAFYNERCKPFINSNIEEAYKLKKSNKLQGLANLKIASRFNDAFLLVIPDLPAALEAKKDLDEALSAIGGEQSKVFTSEFHKKNAGKILFSKEPIVAGKEKPGQFTTSFGPNDPIYAMAYLQGSIRELTGVRDGDNTVPGRYMIKLDGTEQYGLTSLEFKHNKEDWSNAWFPIEVRPNPATAVHGLDATYFADRFADLSPRKHTFGIDFGSQNSSDPYAYGEFQVDWTTGDAQKMKADAKVAVTKAQDNYSKTVQLDPVFNKPGHSFSDPVLSPAALKKAFLAATPNAVQVLKMVTIKEANAVGDWTILRNDYGVIVAKVTAHYTSFVYKAKNGNCYMHYVSQFGRAAIGGNSYGPLAMNPTGMIDERIACENVK